MAWLMRDSIVIEPGSFNTKITLADHLRDPCIIARTVIGYPTNQTSKLVAQPAETIRGGLVGGFLEQELKVSPSNIDLVYPIKTGQVTDWKALSEYWKQFLVHVLHIRRAKNDSPILFAVPPNWNKEEFEELTRMAFEYLNAPGVYIIEQPLLAALGTGTSLSQSPTPALVIDIGHTTTTVTPVIDGVAIRHASRTIPLGGEDIEVYFEKLLREDKEFMSAFTKAYGKLTRADVRGIKESGAVEFLRTPAMKRHLIAREQARLEQLARQQLQQQQQQQQQQQSQSAQGSPAKSPQQRPSSPQNKQSSPSQQKQQQQQQSQLKSPVISIPTEKLLHKLVEYVPRPESDYTLGSNVKTFMPPSSTADPEAPKKAAVAIDGIEMDVDEVIGTKEDLPAPKNPNLRSIEVGESRFDCVDVLFDPSLVGKSVLSLSEVIALVISSVDLERRPQLWESLVLTGGVTSIKGLRERLEYELSGSVLAASETSSEFQPKEVSYRHIPEYFTFFKSRPQDVSLLGGVVVGKLVFQDSKTFITKQDYNNFGPSVSHTKHLS